MPQYAILVLSLLAIVWMVGFIWLRYDIVRQFRRNIRFALLLIGFLLAVSLAFVSIYHPHAHLTDSPGFLFTVALGVATITGFTVTISQLREVNLRVTNYADLLDRATAMLDDMTGRSRWWPHLRETRLLGRWLKPKATEATRHSEWLKFVCNTPTIGNMTLAGTREYEEFEAALRAALRRSAVRVVCLKSNPGDREDAVIKAGNDRAAVLERMNQTELGRFYFLFGDRFEDLGRICGGYRDALGVIADIKANHEVVEKTRDQLPSFHLLVTRRRALVAIPLNLPKRHENLASVHYDPGHRVGVDEVEMLGFDTTDRNIVRRLAAVFDYYASSSEGSSSLGRNDQ